VTSVDEVRAARARAGPVRLRGGRTVVLRWAGPEDTQAIARLFTGLSQESSRSRFHGGLISPAVASRLARVDPSTGMACLVAAVPGEPGRLVAEGRYVPVDGEVAELGITILDEYQGAGLGRILLAELAEGAGRAGYARLRALVNLGNGAMLHLLEPYGWVRAEETDFSVACLEISASGGMPGFPAGSAGRRVLVEQRGWHDARAVAALRQAGYEVRVCAGPRLRTGRPCPLVASGRCRLAEEADLIAPMLPAEDPDCAPVLAAHRRRWPDRLIG